MKGSGYLGGLLETLASVLPLAGILLVLQLVIFRQPLHNTKEFITGFIVTVIGLHLFLAGIELSLIPLGDAVGGNFVTINKKWLVLIIGFIIGYFATLVEPGLKALAMEVEELSAGALPQRVLINAVAIGFGCGMAIGLSRILFNVSYVKIIVPLLVIVVGLVFISPEPFNSIAFDAASATTGPVNIPINMALAVGLASIIEGIDPLLAGFGVVGLTSVGSMISVMVLGVLTKF